MLSDNFPRWIHEISILTEFVEILYILGKEMAIVIVGDKANFLAFTLL